MARSPLFVAVRDALRLACTAGRADGPSPGEWVELRRETRASRRRFVRDVSALALAMAGPSVCAAQKPSPADPKVVIVGAGLAGLVVAYRLARAGVPAEVYEAAPRIGGRIETVRDVVAESLATDLGAEFIDSDQDAVRGLARELGVGLLDTRADERAAPIAPTYFFGGQHHTEAQVVEALGPVADRVLADRDRIGRHVDYRHPDRAEALDRTSVAAYLDAIGIRGWVRDLLDVTWATEFGLDVDRQSALNLILSIARPKVGATYPLFGEHDERYKVAGGTDRLIAALAERMDDRVHREHRLEAIRAEGAGLVLTLAGPSGRAVDVLADAAVLCVPFTTLRHVDLRIELPPAKRRAIAELGYGTNAKLVLGFSRPVWRGLGHSGRILTDAPFQAAWDNGARADAGPAALSLFTGGRRGVEVEAGPPADRATSLLPGVNAAYPGTGAAWTGRVARSAWIGRPLSRGSYSCYMPGQWTSISGTEGEPAGALYFAGEHCDPDSQGYMDGAVRSANAAARALLARLGKSTPRR
jgi:monoamine oxidase